MTSTLAAKMIEPKVADHPRYKPREAAQNLLREHGITLSYPQAHWAKRKALEALHGDFAASFGAIHQYCELLNQVNVGTEAYYDTDPNTGMFQRTFVAFGASLGEFFACRPVVGLDGTHLRHSYKGEFYRLFVLYVRAEINYRPLGILLMAVALDVKGQLFPLAFGVCSVENQDNCEWLYGIFFKLSPSAQAVELHGFRTDRRVSSTPSRHYGPVITTHSALCT